MSELKFRKYTAGVYCLEAEEQYKHGDVVTVPTRRGKEVEVTIWKHLFTKNGVSYHSYIRCDGINSGERLQHKAEKHRERSVKAAAESDRFYAKSNEHSGFLSLGEPIKVGHHSESRHRRIIEQANTNMGKCVAASNKASDLESRADGAEAASENIFIDTPECLPRLREKLDRLVAFQDDAKARRKAGDDVPHFVTANNGANVRRVKKQLETAEKLWELPKAEGGAS